MGRQGNLRATHATAVHGAIRPRIHLCMTKTSSSGMLAQGRIACRRPGLVHSVAAWWQGGRARRGLHMSPKSGVLLAEQGHPIHALGTHTHTHTWAPGGRNTAMLPQQATPHLSWGPHNRGRLDARDLGRRAGRAGRVGPVMVGGRHMDGTRGTALRSGQPPHRHDDIGEPFLYFATLYVSKARIRKWGMVWIYIKSYDSIITYATAAGAACQGRSRQALRQAGTYPWPGGHAHRVTLQASLLAVRVFAPDPGDLGAHRAGTGRLVQLPPGRCGRHGPWAMGHGHGHGHGHGRGAMGRGRRGPCGHPAPRPPPRWTA